ncbi:MAG: hypothetical protein EOO66_23330, partial [Methylobacterium sp.]
MADELDQGFYPAFERKWRIGAWTMRALMAAIIVATMVGLLGGGPVSLLTLKVKNGPVTVEYAPIVRFGTPTGLVIDADVAEGQSEVVVTLQKSLVEKYGLQSVIPQPKEWRTGTAGDVELVLAVQPGAKRAVVRLGGMPAGAGPMGMWARLGGEDGAEVR